MMCYDFIGINYTLVSVKQKKKELLINSNNLGSCHAVFVDVLHELLDVTVAQVLEMVEALVGEYLGVADSPAVAPPVVGRSPRQGVAYVGLGRHRLKDGAVGEGLVVLLEDFLGGGRRRGDDHRDGAQSEREEGAVGLGHGGERLVGLRAELEEVPNDREPGRTGRPVFIATAVQEKPDYD